MYVFHQYVIHINDIYMRQCKNYKSGVVLPRNLCNPHYLEFSLSELTGDTYVPALVFLVKLFSLCLPFKTRLFTQYVIISTLLTSTTLIIQCITTRLIDFLKTFY